MASEEIVAIFKAETRQYEESINRLQAELRSLADTQEKAMKELREEMEKNKKEQEELGDKMEEAGRLGEQAFSRVDTALGGVASAIRGGAKSLGIFTAGLGKMKTAILASGIGAFVLALGSVVTALTQTQEGIDALNRKAAASASQMSVLKGKVIDTGKSLLKFFGADSESLKGTTLLSTAIYTLTRGNVVLNAQLKAVGKTAEELAGFMQGLRIVELNLNKTRADSRARIKELNLIGEDTTRGYEERIDALKETLAIETDLLERQTTVVERRLETVRKEIALNKDGDKTKIEDLERINELEVELANLRLESFEMQTTQNNKVNILVAEQQRKQQEAVAAKKQQEKDLLDFFRESIETEEAIDTAAIEAEIERDYQAYQTKLALQEEFEEEAEAKLQQHLDNMEEMEEESTESWLDELGRRSKKLTESFTMATNAGIEFSENEIARLEKQAEGESGFRKKQIEMEIRDHKRRVQNLQRAQQAALLINEAVALSRAFADLGPIAGGVAAVGLGIKFALLLRQLQFQEYAEGTDFVMPAHPSQGRGVDDIPAWLTKGEAVIPVKQNKEHHGLVKAIRGGDVEKYITESYVVPELKKMVTGETSGMSVHAHLNDQGIIGATKELRRSQERSFSRLISSIDKQSKRSRRAI